MSTIIFEGYLGDIASEDSGTALIAENFESDTEPHLFIKLQSWDKDKNHPMFNQLKNKKLRIIVEVIPDEA